MQRLQGYENKRQQTLNLSKEIEVMSEYLVKPKEERKA
jgi:hypothetical protein